LKERLLKERLEKALQKKDNGNLDLFAGTVESRRLPIVGSLRN